MHGTLELSNVQYLQIIYLYYHFLKTFVFKYCWCNLVQDRIIRPIKLLKSCWGVLDRTQTVPNHMHVEFCDFVHMVKQGCCCEVLRDWNTSTSTGFSRCTIGCIVDMEINFRNYALLKWQNLRYEMYSLYRMSMFSLFQVLQMSKTCFWRGFSIYAEQVGLTNGFGCFQF